MNFFDYFQVASVAIVLLIFVGRASYLRFRRNINPISIGGGKKGVLLAVELVAIVGFVAWMIEVLLFALHSGFRIFPSPLDSQLINSLPAKIAGAALVTSGLVIFGSAYASGLRLAGCRRSALADPSGRGVFAQALWPTLPKLLRQNRKVCFLMRRLPTATIIDSVCQDGASR